GAAAAGGGEGRVEREHALLRAQIADINGARAGGTFDNRQLCAGALRVGQLENVLCHKYKLRLCLLLSCCRLCRGGRTRPNPCLWYRGIPPCNGWRVGRRNSVCLPVVLYPAPRAAARFASACMRSAAGSIIPMARGASQL